MPAPDVKLRIALPTGIFPPDIGGPASYVPRIAEALTGRGHAVEVITLADHPAAGGAYAFPVRRIRRGMSRLPRMLRTISAIARAARSADLIYANGLFIEAAIVAALVRRPLAMKIVGDWAWERARNRGETTDLAEFQARRQSPRSEAVKRLRSTVTRSAGRILTPSRFLADTVAGWGIPKERIAVVYNALEPPPDPEPAALPAFSGSTLVTVARLVAWKGVSALIHLTAAHKRWRLVVVGDGPERANLEAQAEREGAAGRVIFTGGVARAQVVSYLKAADLFVLNSLYEGLPHIILEAFAAGAPVVATSAGGTVEVVADGVNGLLVPPGSDDRLAVAIERMLSEPRLRSALAEAGRRTLAGRFQWETMVVATETLLAETAHRGAARS